MMVGLSATFCLIALLVAVQSGLTAGVDNLGRSATLWSRAHDLTGFLHWVELAFAQPFMSIYVALLVGVLLWFREPRIAVLVLLANAVTFLVTAALKAEVGRDRPAWQAPGHILSSPAFPSGHSSSATSLIGSIILAAFALSWSRRWNAAVPISLTAVGLGLTGLVCADRILLGRHYPSDVVGGILLGIIVLAASTVITGVPASSKQRDTLSRWSDQANEGTVAPGRGDPGRPGAGS